MLTDEGKLHIKRYLAGYTASIAQSIAIGIGTNSESALDKKLQFEVGRSNIILTGYDFSTDKLIFKASVPEGLSGVVREVALYSSPTDEQAGQYGSKLITSFDSDTEDWVNPSTLALMPYATANAKIGKDSLSVTANAGGGQSASLSEMFLDLSGHPGTDKFAFAYHVDNAFVSSIQFRFMTDTSNFYQITLGSQTTGYKIVEVAKSGVTVTGSPSWSNITEIRTIVNSTAGGGARVDFDGIRIDNEETNNAEYVMVARELLPTEFIKQAGKVQEVEFALDVSTS